MKIYNDYYDTKEWCLNEQKGTVETASKKDEGLPDEMVCPSCCSLRMRCKVCVICLLKSLGSEKKHH